MAIKVVTTLDFDDLIYECEDSTGFLSCVIEDNGLDDKLMALLEKQFENTTPTIRDIEDYLHSKEVTEMVLNSLKVIDFADFEDILATMHFLNVDLPVDFLKVNGAEFMETNREKTLAEIVRG